MSALAACKQRSDAGGSGSVLLHSAGERKAFSIGTKLECRSKPHPVATNLCAKSHVR